MLVDNVPRGTLITNQATVYSTEVANVLTDADADPSNGAQPTVVVVGDAQFLSIVKDVTVVGGGAALPGATLEYTVVVQNNGNVPALYVLLRDDLDEVTPGYLTYVDQSATLNGQPVGVSVAGNVITADYFNDYGPLEPGQSITSAIPGRYRSKSGSGYDDDQPGARLLRRPAAAGRGQCVHRRRRDAERRHDQWRGLA